LCNYVYEIYSSDSERVLKDSLERLRFKKVVLTEEEQRIYNDSFSNVTPPKMQAPQGPVDKEGDQEGTIKSGVKTTTAPSSGPSSDPSSDPSLSI
jgi:hypothetical protein